VCLCRHTQHIYTKHKAYNTIRHISTIWVVLLVIHFTINYGSVELFSRCDWNLRWAKLPVLWDGANRCAWFMSDLERNLNYPVVIFNATAVQYQVSAKSWIVATDSITISILWSLRWSGRTRRFYIGLIAIICGYYVGFDANAYLLPVVEMQLQHWIDKIGFTSIYGNRLYSAIYWKWIICLHSPNQQSVANIQGKPSNSLINQALRNPSYSWSYVGSTSNVTKRKSHMLRKPNFTAGSGVTILSPS